MSSNAGDITENSTPCNRKASLKSPLVVRDTFKSLLSDCLALLKLRPDDPVVRSHETQRDRGVVGMMAVSAALR